VLWIATGTGLIAIFFAIIADGLAAFPTVIKSFKFPETENWVIYFAASISALITLFTIKVWDFETFAFSLYIFLLTLMLSGLIKFRLGQRIQKSFPN